MLFTGSATLADRSDGGGGTTSLVGKRNDPKSGEDFIPPDENLRDFIPERNRDISRSQVCSCSL